MARKRQIDPGFWTSEQVVSLSIPARLLFVGMISTADDEGRLKGAALCLKLTIFPGDAADCGQVAEWRDEVVASGLAKLYAGQDGTELLWMPNWHKHQYVQRRYPSKLPPHTDDSDTSNGTVTERSDTAHRKYVVGTGVEVGVGTEKTAVVQSAKAVPEALRLFLEDKGAITANGIKKHAERIIEKYGDLGPEVVQRAYKEAAFQLTEHDYKPRSPVGWIQKLFEKHARILREEARK